MGTFSTISGSLLGTALGDSIGLPYEGARPDQVKRLVGVPLQQAFTPGGNGWASDDTDHTRLVLTALITDPTGGEAFERSLAWGLRWWFWSLPVGIGLGTARALVKLSLGVPPRWSGVNSAGNGPAMRAAILGAWSNDPTWLVATVRRTTCITHTDTRAEHGALLVARLAALSPSQRNPVSVRAAMDDLDPRLVNGVTPVLEGFEAGETPDAMVDSLGVSGFVLHTVPAVVAIVLTHPDDFRAGITTAVRLGGDTDTVGAIVGGILGAWVGREGLPEDWLASYGDWPWSVERLDALAAAAVEGRPAPTAPPLALFKNLMMLPLALGHLFRRHSLVVRR